MNTDSRCLGCYRSLPAWAGRFCNPRCERLWARRRAGGVRAPTR
jgi:hypothetical protein